MQEVYRKIISLIENHAFSEAEKLCLFELGKLDKADAQLLFYLGTCAHVLHRSDAALVAFNAALELEPANVNYLQAAASSYEAAGDYISAYKLMLRASEKEPDNLNVLANFGVSLERLGRLQEAADIYAKVLKQDPLQAVANINYGEVLHNLGYKEKALAHNRLAHDRLPVNFAVLYNLIDTLIANFNYEEALSHCEQGLAWNPTHAHLIMKKAMVLGALSRSEESLACCSKARIINPNVVRDLLPWTRNLPKTTSVYMDGHVFEYEARFEEQRSCYWAHRACYLDKLRADIDGGLHKNKALAGPENAFKVLPLELDSVRRLALLRNISVAMEDTAWLVMDKPFVINKKTNNKLRIGYLSPDFRLHPLSILTRQVYAMHDRELFEIYAYSVYQEPRKDRYRLEVEGSCDVFREAAKLSAVDTAKLINHDEIDILVDLAGYTTHARAEIMAMRPAPLQMHYLGFMQSMGADFIDYMLLDKHLYLDGNPDEWYERCIRLPHSLWPYDNETDNKTLQCKREHFGLPEHSFVFCCFNTSYKIEPVIFSRWMNILKAVPGSVLWLLGKGSDVQKNLEREAAAHGIEKSRLVFTTRVSPELHVQRYQLADLFLDTYWVNAHTTAAEALWQGLPLITIMGEVSAARGAASILAALEMPELIVQNHDDYEQLAIYYATHPQAYTVMKEELQAKRYTAPMYNTKLTVKHIERAYRMAWERHQTGLPPASFDVPEIDDPELRKSIH